MTVTTTALGANTKQISISGELDSAAIQSAVHAAIIADGWWTLYDDVHNSFKVYRAINADATSYKYASISIDVMKQKIWLQVWENWNTTTHSGTNQAFDAYGGYYQTYTFNNSDIVVFVHPRYLGLHSYIRSVPGPWPVFCVETTRDNPQDTAAAGYPCWGFFTPSMVTQLAPIGSGSVAASVNTEQFSYPRIRDGSTGRTAAQRAGVSAGGARVISRGQFETTGGSYRVTAQNVHPNGGLSALMAPANVNPWDSTQALIYAPRVWSGLVTLQGRMHAIKASRIVGGALMTTVPVPVDTSDMFSSTGTSKDHYVIPMWCEQSLTTTSIASAIGVNIDATDVVINGTYAYVGTKSFGILKVDLQSGGYTTVTNTAGTTAKSGFVFAGRYLYFCDPGNTRIGVIDTTTDTVTYGPATTGFTCYRMVFDGTVLVALDNSPISSAITARRFDPATLTQLGTLTLNNVLSLNVRGGDIGCDPWGNMVVHLSDNAGNPRTYRLFGNAITGVQAISTSLAPSQWLANGCSYTGIKGLIMMLGGNTTSTIVTPGWVLFDVSSLNPAAITGSTSHPLGTAVAVGAGGTVPNYAPLVQWGRGFIHCHNVASTALVWADIAGTVSTDAYTLLGNSAAANSPWCSIGVFGGLCVNLGNDTKIFALRPADAAGAAAFLLPK